MRLLILSFLILIVSSAYADNKNIYECVITKISNSNNLSNLEKYYLNKAFNVDRMTGVMTGTLINGYINDPIVIDSGSESNSFKVVNYLKAIEGLGKGSNIYALVVEEYRTGVIKPFTYMQNDWVFRGNCQTKN